MKILRNTRRGRNRCETRPPRKHAEDERCLARGHVMCCELTLCGASRCLRFAYFGFVMLVVVFRNELLLTCIFI